MKPTQCATQRVIILGVDGVPHTQIKRLAQEGKLPNFKKLMNAGQFHPLKTEVPPITAMGWPTIYTGVNPGKHGLYDFGPVDKNALNVVRFHNPVDCQAEFLWEILERNGIKSGVVGVPMSSPFRNKPTFGEGDHLRGDWVHFDEWKNKDNFARVIHTHPAFNERIYSMMHNKFDQLEYALDTKMPAEGVQFLALTVYVIDPLQHFRWTKFPVVEKGFKLIDDRMGKIMKKLKPNDTLIVVSDHGMTRLEKMFYTNKWLEHRGYLVLKKKQEKKTMEKIGEKSFINVQTFEKLTMPIINMLITTNMIKHMPKSLARLYDYIRKKVLPSKKRDSVGWDKILPDVDWKKTKAYSVGCVGNIYLNIKEREKYGSVAKKEAHKLAEKIRQELIADAEKNEMKAEVHFREEIYSGNGLEHCPDIIPLIDGGSVLTTSGYPLADTWVRAVAAEEAQTATHDMFGIFGAYGKNVTGIPGEKVLSVRDITPTVLRLFGLTKEIKGMDGRVLDEFFTKLSTPGTPEAPGSVAVREEEKITDALAGIQF